MHVVVQNQRVCSYQRVAADADAIDADQGGSADAAAVLQNDACLIGKGGQAGVMGKSTGFIRVREWMVTPLPMVMDAPGNFLMRGNPEKNDACSGAHPPEPEQQAAYPGKQMDKE